MLLVISCTSVYKQAPIQTVLLLALVLRCTNRHQNEPIFSCLCLRGGAFSRIMYFGAQAGTKNKPVDISNARLQFFLNHILVQFVYVYQIPTE